MATHSQVTRAEQPRAFGYSRYLGAEIDQLRSECHEEQWSLQALTFESFTDEPMMDRPVARELLRGMDRGDWLIAVRYTDVFNDVQDCVVTCRWLRWHGLNLRLVESPRINANIPEAAIIEHAKQALKDLKHEVWTPEKSKKNCIGWHLAPNGKIEPNAEARVAALHIVRMHDGLKMDFKEIAEENKTEKFWPGVLTQTLAKNIYVAAKERFPGPHGEIEESMEGMGI